MAWSRGFKKCLFYCFLDVFLANIFTIKMDFAKLQQKKSDSKSRALELSNDVYISIFYNKKANAIGFIRIIIIVIVIFGHQTWDLEGVE